MDPERYLLVKQAFAEVSRAPLDEREEILRRVCGDDAELRREVEALLEYDQSEAGGVLGDEPAPKRPESRASSSSSFEGDFAPGEVLIGRYRVVALVGEGGMGQVYRADDLVLGQPVALKFLPEHLAERAHGLDRFRAEVRHAREVTHPNVARVHDIGEVGGRHFLTMEFVDGEDLASLIKRIGRLPPEKASQIAQQVCSALSEAHRKGVLHRDLKPANVMLDGNGQVRLTDFGLAVLAAEESEATLAGTPQYMAPEQLAGVPASVQSEVYSLGLLLYELYTGHRALRGRSLDELRREHEDGGPDPPSSHLSGIDASVEAVLSSCLARAPEERPRSVLEVARALPGGDPLAAALAAGETPAPEVVAGTPTRGALDVTRARALLIGAFALVVVVVLLRTFEDVALGKAPAVLRERANELATRLAGGHAFPYELHWYWSDDTPAHEGGSDGVAEERSGASPSWVPIGYHSRYGPEPIVASPEGPSAVDPAFGRGSAYLALDANGALLCWRYELVEEGRPPTTDGGELEPAWEELLRWAGFDPAKLVPAEPKRVPDVFATERLAWVPAEGADDSGDPIRIEAAALGGRPVSFEVTRAGEPVGQSVAPISPGPPWWWVLGVVVLVVVYASRNVRRGRADVSGALRIGAFHFGAHLLLMFAIPVPSDVTGFGAHLAMMVPAWTFMAVLVALCYLAIEPFARKCWPSCLIAWTRLVKGRIGDAAVGREVLFGLAAAPALVVLSSLVHFALDAAGFDSGWTPVVARVSAIEGPVQALSYMLHAPADLILNSLAGVFVLVLLRSVVPLAWGANVIWVVLLAAIFAKVLPSPMPPCDALLLAALELLLLTRVGFLAIVALSTVHEWLRFPLTFRRADWYFFSSFAVLALITVVAVSAYRASIGRWTRTPSR